MPAYVHFEGEALFISHELGASLREKGIASSQTASYNGQVERYNG